MKRNALDVFAADYNSLFSNFLLVTMHMTENNSKVIIICKKCELNFFPSEYAKAIS